MPHLRTRVGREMQAVMKHRSVGTSGLRGLATWARHTDMGTRHGTATRLLRSYSRSPRPAEPWSDTSPAYGAGAAQRILAELLDDVVPRDELIISSSAGIDPTPIGTDRVDCSRRGLLRQLDATLRELGNRLPRHVAGRNLGSAHACRRGCSNPRLRRLERQGCGTSEFAATSAGSSRRP